MTYTNEELLNIFKSAGQRNPFNLSDSSIRTYAMHVELFLEACKKEVFDITKKDLKVYLSTTEMSDKSYNMKLSSLKKFYEVLSYDARTEDMVKLNPTIGIISIKGIKTEPKVPLTDKEKEVMLNNSINPRNYAIMTVMLKTMVRIHELVELTYEQYMNRDEKGRIKLDVNKGGYKDEYIYINKEAEMAIESYLKVRKNGSDKLFVSNYGNKMTASCINKMLKNVAKKSGIKEDRVKKVTPHLLRATGATDMLNNDVPIDVVAEALRHHGLGSVQRYAKVAESRVREAMQWEEKVIKN